MPSNLLKQGILLHQQGNNVAAINLFNEVLASNPSCYEAYLVSALALQSQKQLDRALLNIDKALEIRPDAALALTVKAGVLNSLGMLEQALDFYDKSLEIQSSALAHHNCGVILALLRRFDEALNSFELALGVDENYLASKWDHAILSLKLGRYSEGLVGHEMRASTPPPDSAKHIPRWIGNESLQGKTILLYAELGFGDTLHFCRYATLAANLGANVILYVQPALKDLLQSLDDDITVLSTNDSHPELDFQIPLLSLPFAFQTTLETIPSKARYLRPPLEKISYWKNRLSDDAQLKVGLVWSGGEKTDWAIEFYSHRNLSLERLGQIANPCISFYSLQKGNLAAQELNFLDDRWQDNKPIDLTDQLQDFSDTAALIENLDLVITVDTSVAHLAGALGKPVWILNRFDGDWRWLLGREDSPWYPTAKLYRQKTPGDWDEVLERVKIDLQKKVDEHLTAAQKAIC
jgi:tetratricopeptide (TPR) repeat protein